LTKPWPRQLPTHHRSHRHGPDNQFISGRDQVILHKGDYYIGLSPRKMWPTPVRKPPLIWWLLIGPGKRLPDKEVQRADYPLRVGKHLCPGNQRRLLEFGAKITETVDASPSPPTCRAKAVARFTPPKGGSVTRLWRSGCRHNLYQRTRGGESPIRSSIFIWVAGEDDVSGGAKTRPLTLISDKAEYAPGETAEILIPSPFSGEHKALVTVERGRIISRKLSISPAAATMYRLPLTEQYAPNIYVSVVLVQGREGPTKDNAPRLADYKVGLLPIDVSPIAQTTQHHPDPAPEQAQPGENVTYNLQVTDVNNQPVAAEFSLDLVDKAVLSLQPRPADAIVQAFYGGAAWVSIPSGAGRERQSNFAGTGRGFGAGSGCACGAGRRRR
jgi:hypothetical protein